MHCEYRIVNIGFREAHLYCFIVLSANPQSQSKGDIPVNLEGTDNHNLQEDCYPLIQATYCLLV